MAVSKTNQALLGITSSSNYFGLWAVKLKDINQSGQPYQAPEIPQRNYQHVSPPSNIPTKKYFNQKYEQKEDEIRIKKDINFEFVQKKPREEENKEEPSYQMKENM